MKQYDVQWKNRIDHATFIFISIISMGINLVPQCGRIEEPNLYFIETVSFRNYCITQNNLTSHLPITTYRLYTAHTQIKNAPMVFDNFINGSPSFHCCELALTSFICWGSVYVIHVIWLSLTLNLHRKTLNQERVRNTSSERFLPSWVSTRSTHPTNLAREMAPYGTSNRADRFML
jgi:hypothetical protein